MPGQLVAGLTCFCMVRRWMRFDDGAKSYGSGRDGDCNDGCILSDCGFGATKHHKRRRGFSKPHTTQRATNINGRWSQASISGVKPNP